MYGYISGILRREGIPYLVLNSPDEISSKFDLIVTSLDEEPFLRTWHSSNNHLENEENERGKFPSILGITLGSPLNEGILRTLPLSNLEKLSSTWCHQRLLIGIDPGEHVGIVALSEHSFLMAETLLFDIKQVLRYLKAMINRFSSKHVCIKVGNGEDIYSYPLINAMHSDFQERISSGALTIEEVNEDYTSANKKKFSRRTLLSVHEYAALMIAGRKGTIVKEPIRFMVTNGRIKDMKRKSRLLSNGRLTISTKLAINVINGEITLKDAIIQQEKK